MMSPTARSALADVILLIHFAIIAFNLFGLFVVPIGGWRGWPFVRVVWWRVLHLLSLAIVALQACLGRACFLTDWQRALENSGSTDAAPAPMIMTWINHLIFWPLPLWVFSLIYVAVALYALSLWWLVPPRRMKSA